MCRHYSITELNDLMFWCTCLFTVVPVSRVRAHVLTINIPVEHTIEWLKFSLLMMCWRHQYLQLQYLFIDTYKDALDCRVTVLVRVLNACIIRENSIFKTANQPGFEPGSPGPKVAVLTIELHSINNNNKSYVYICFLDIRQNVTYETYSVDWA